MTTDDRRTIEDGGVRSWQVSGSVFFELLDKKGSLIVGYNRGPALNRSGVAKGLEIGLRRPEEPVLLALGDRIYEISTQPLYFGPKEHGTLLGFVAVGYSIDEHVARAVSEAAAAEVTFTVDGRVVVSTLSPELQRQLIARGDEFLRLPTQNKKIELGRVDYLAASERLTMSDGQEGAIQVPQLVVLKSFAGATQLVDRVNRWVLTRAVLTLVAGQ